MGATGAVGLVDIGATHTRVAVTSSAAGFDDHHRFETDHSLTGPLKTIEALHDLAGSRSLKGVVIGVPAEFDRQTGTLKTVTNLPQWNGIALAREFEQALGTKVLLENDTALGGLGEAHFGAGRGYGLVVYETVSTGVNAVRIVDGMIDRSAGGFEAGRQLIMGPDGRVTSLEAATSGAALERKYGHSPRELASQRLWRSEAKLLALGLYNSLLHWSPELVIFGGSMMRDIELGEIEAELRKLPVAASQGVPLVHAQLGDSCGLYGALALAHQHKLI